MRIGIQGNGYLDTAALESTRPPDQDDNAVSRPYMTCTMTMH